MTEAAEPDLDLLWAKYKATDDRAFRDELIVHYTSLVRYVASRVASGLPHTVDQGDLVSYGVFGLIDAIEKFDPDRGYKFETYAIARIKGHIVDELRAMDWVPRSVRSKARSLEQAYGALEAKLHRAPTESEVAEAMGITEGQLQTILGQVSFTGLVALDETVRHDEGDASSTLGDTLPDPTPGPQATFETQEMRQILSDAISRLSERDQRVLSLYYFDGLTLAEIGRELGVTESRVCQIHTKAVVQLRARLAAAEREPA